MATTIHLIGIVEKNEKVDHRQNLDGALPTFGYSVFFVKTISDYLLVCGVE